MIRDVQVCSPKLALLSACHLKAVGGQEISVLDVRVSET